MSAAIDSGPDERPAWLTRLVQVDTAIAKVEGVVVVVSLLSMLTFYFLYVVFRNVSASLGANWLSELPLQLVLWVSLFGGSIAARNGRHIGIDIAPRVLPKKALRFVRVVTNLFAVTMAAAPRSFLNCRARSCVKKAGTVSVPASVACRAISRAGSTPSTRIPRSPRKRRSVPSLLPTSTAKLPCGGLTKPTISSA